MTLLWAFLLLVLAVILIATGRRQRAATGVPAGDLLYSDTARWDRLSRPLFSHRLRLAGKPDYVVHAGREVAPVEVKSGAAPRHGPYDSHVCQLAAYCALVEDHFGVRPTHGLIQYADESFTVEYTPELEHGLYSLMKEMRLDADRGDVERSHADAARCRGCGFSQVCEQSLA